MDFQSTYNAFKSLAPTEQLLVDDMYDEAGIVKANWNKVFKNMVIRAKPQTAVEAKESIGSLPEVIERNRRRKSLRKSKHRQSVTKAFREQKTKKMDIQEEIKSVSDSEEEKGSRVWSLLIF